MTRYIRLKDKFVNIDHVESAKIVRNTCTYSAQISPVNVTTYSIVFFKSQLLAKLVANHQYFNDNCKIKLGRIDNFPSYAAAERILIAILKSEEPVIDVAEMFTEDERELYEFS